jgi:hypothetical protein
MYELKATINPADADLLLDALILSFEAQGKDCTCGIVGDLVIGYVEEEMLSTITAIILRYAPQVHVQIAVEDEALAVA